MPKTFDPNLSTDKDWVRMLTGDRDISRSSVTDEEINAVLEAEGNRYRAAYQIGMTIYSIQGGIVSKQVDDLRIDYDKSTKGSDAYLKYLKSLQMRGAGKTAAFRVVRQLP